MDPNDDALTIEQLAALSRLSRDPAERTERLEQAAADLQRRGLVARSGDSWSLTQAGLARLLQQR